MELLNRTWARGISILTPTNAANSGILHNRPVNLDSLSVARNFTSESCGRVASPWLRHMQNALYSFRKSLPRSGPCPRKDPLKSCMP
jgi:hypothetical protein